MKIATILAAALAVTLPCAPLVAQDTTGGELTQIVTYADLDLSRADDLRTLDRRLKSAIDQVCGPTSSADPVGTREVRRCRAALREQVAERRANVLAGLSPNQPIRISLEVAH